MGSNSFRLVVFTAADGWWKRTDEIYRAVRVGEGLDATGELGAAPLKRALEAAEVFAHFCTATGIGAGDIHAVATSAIRDAANQQVFLDRVRDETGLAVSVLSREEEAYFGYLAAVNSTTLGRRRGARPRRRLAAARRGPAPALRPAGLLAARRRPHDRALPRRGRPAGQEGAQGAEGPRGRAARARRAVAGAQRPADRRPRRHAAQPRLRRAGGGRTAVHRRAGLRDHARRAARAHRPARRDEGGRARLDQGHQVRARRPHPRRRARRRRRARARRLRRDRGRPRRACARASSSALPRGRPAAVRRRARARAC